MAFPELHRMLLSHCRPLMCCALTLTPALTGHRHVPLAASPTIPDVPASTANGDTTSTPGVTTVPIRVVNGYVLIKATVNGHTGWWTIDTGIDYIVVNAQYFEASEQTGGFDTTSHPVLLDSEQLQAEQYTAKVYDRITVKTVQVGSLMLNLNDQLNAAVTTPPPKIGADSGRPPLGWLGLPVWKNIELILDYPNQRATLIQLDDQGQRVTPVPSRKAIHTIPMRPMWVAHYGVYAQLGGGPDSTLLLLDTGAPGGVMTSATRGPLASHLKNGSRNSYLNKSVVVLDQLRMNGVADQVTYRGIGFFAEDSFDFNILGYPFLRAAGVVGFNWKLQQFSIYR